MTSHRFGSHYRHNGHIGPSQGADQNDPEAIKDQMAKVRRGLQADAVSLARSAQQAADWKFYVHKFPLVCAGVALAVGYSLVPPKKGPLVASDEQLEKLAKAGHLKVVADQSVAEKPGMLHKAMFALGSLAVRAALNHVGQTLAARNSHTATNGHTTNSREY